MLYEQLKAGNCAWNQVIIIINDKRKKPTLPFYLLPAAPALIHLDLAFWSTVLPMF